MRVVPKKKVPKIQFFSSRLPKWLEHAEAIGIPADQVALLQGQVALALEKFKAQQKLQQEAEAATLAFHLAVEAMNTNGVSLLQQIRARAAILGDDIFGLASVPAPAKPSPTGAR